MLYEEKADTTIQRHEPVPEGCREIWLAGGCFWGTQEYLSGMGGIVHTSVGYANGNTPFPTYEAVCSHATGYVEAVHAVYDPNLISLRFLLELYFQSVNPTSVNRQSGDVGVQYRTGIYYLNNGDLPVIRSAIDKLARGIKKPVAIEVEPLQNYYLAEEYHQDYLRKNPGGYCHISLSLISFARTAREYKNPDDERLKESLTPVALL